MAGATSNFERMMTNNGPIQTSITRNLTRWEFRNLQLAGVRIPASRGFRRKHLIPDRCDEWDPQKRLRRCANTTKTFDEIRACSGSPAFSPGTVLEDSIAAQRTQACLRPEVWWWREDSQDNCPNAGKYPEHTKVCRRCRDSFAAEELNDQLRQIAGFRTPLCKSHSLQQAKQLPLNACRCFAFVNDKWRCSYCYCDTLYYLASRAHVFRISLVNKQIPWYHPWAYLTSLRAERRMVCPIKGCFQQPWLHENRDRMHFCMACETICRT